MDKIKVGIIGAGGYGGCGAIEILTVHPRAEITALFDKQDLGKPISDLYPHLKGFCDLPLLDSHIDIGEGPEGAVVEIQTLCAYLVHG